MGSNRIDKINYFLDIAKSVAERSTCLRKKVGCVIVNNDEIIATGYNGAPRGRKNCIDIGFCTKKKQFPDIRHGGYDACRSVHAEQNAIISAGRKDMMGSFLFIVGKDAKTGEYVQNSMPCAMCKRVIINSGIEKIYLRDTKTEYRVLSVQDFIDNDESLDGKLGY